MIERYHPEQRLAPGVHVLRQPYSRGWWLVYGGEVARVVGQRVYLITEAPARQRFTTRSAIRYVAATQREAEEFARWHQWSREKVERGVERERERLTVEHEARVAAWVDARAGGRSVEGPGAGTTGTDEAPRGAPEGQV